MHLLSTPLPIPPLGRCVRAATHKGTSCDSLHVGSLGRTGHALLATPSPAGVWMAPSPLFVFACCSRVQRAASIVLDRPLHPLLAGFGLARFDLTCRVSSLSSPGLCFLCLRCPGPALSMHCALLYSVGRSPSLLVRPAPLSVPGVVSAIPSGCTGPSSSGSDELMMMMMMYIYRYIKKCNNTN